MNKKEIAEIKKRFTKTKCSFTRLCGCYVDADKQKRMTLKEAFLGLPEEEMFKYIDIFRKTLSGSIGNKRRWHAGIFNEAVAKQADR